MEDRILGKIIKKTGVPDLLDLLSNQLTSSDWQSLLLAVTERRMARQGPADLLQQYQHNRFVQPLRTIPKSLLMAFEQAAYDGLPNEVECLTLSPVSPLGTCSGVATVHPNKVLATIRKLEVVSDATNVLALEASLRRKKELARSPKSQEMIHLATSHRHLRTQAFDNPGFTAHFQVHCMVSAGRDMGHFQFEKLALQKQIAYYLRLMTHPDWGISADRLELGMSLFKEELAPLYTSITAALKEEFPEVRFRLAPERESGQGYYRGLCFYIFAHLPNGSSIPFCDGGLTDWTQQLIGSRKERLLISGFGSELWLNFFQATL